MALVLIGPPTAGKTSVGEMVAKRLGRPFVDIDQAVERATGRSVAQVFTEWGEAGFRAVESAAAVRALGNGNAVVSLGGGAVMQRSVRESLPGHEVVWLDVEPSEAALRASATPGQRPLLGDDPAGRIASLMEERRATYASVATLRVDTTFLTTFEVAGEVVSLTSDPPVVFATERPYHAFVGHGSIARLAPLMAGAERVGIISSSALSHVAQRVSDEAVASGAKPFLIEVPVGEAAKTAAVVASCWNQLAEWGFTRTDLVIGIGGGATTDMAGFVAASYLRGIAWLAVSTSVLGMVDAAIGGKTGIDIPQGKNLVGAFHEPRAVIADLVTLTTLPQREVRSGLAEAIKEGFTDDAAILDLVEASPDDVLDVNSARLAEIITRAVQVKAVVVAGDLRERTTTGATVGRERLNYGHTLGHAIEAQENFEMRHGEAVAIGCVFAAEVAHRLVGLPREVVDRHRAVFSSVGLPVSYSGALWDDLRTRMSRDKKTRGSSLRMVLLRGLGDVVVVKDPPEDVLRAAFEALAETSHQG
ncbi:MAG: 3-dehydroquinate synthase [Propionibacteriaceae bacterium]|nr:3-dehydroquinate synthase [Propionibacteriaceae bacterium]